MDFLSKTHQVVSDHVAAYRPFQSQCRSCMWVVSFPLKIDFRVVRGGEMNFPSGKSKIHYRLRGDTPASSVAMCFVWAVGFAAAFLSLS